MENTRSDLVRRLFEAFFAGDRATVDALLSPDYRFSSIDDPGIDKAAYFERCWPNHERLRDVELKTVIESGDDVFVRYAATPPDGQRFHNMERIRVGDGAITQSEVYYGPPAAAFDG